MFKYYARNQRVKIRIYGEFDGNRKVHLFGTAPLMGFGSFFLLLLKISFLLNNNGFRGKMCGTLKIDLFIRYHFCGKYFFPRTIFIDIKLKKNLLKTFFLVLTLKIKFAGILIIIFVINASKYVGIVNFKLIGDNCFSEVYLYFFCKTSSLLVLFKFWIMVAAYLGISFYQFTVQIFICFSLPQSII